MGLVAFYKRAGLQGHDDIVLIEQPVSRPVAFGPGGRVRGVVFGHLKDGNDVQPIEPAIRIGVARAE